MVVDRLDTTKAPFDGACKTALDGVILRFGGVGGNRIVTLTHCFITPFYLQVSNVPTYVPTILSR